MTDDELTDIDARANAASPGPWKATHRHSLYNQNNDEAAGLGLEIEGPPEASNRGQFALGADARFIAFARSDIPALIAEIRRLRTLVDKYQVVIDAAKEWDDSEGMNDSQLSSAVHTLLEVEA